MPLPHHLRKAFGDLINQIKETGEVPMRVSYLDGGQRETESTERFLIRFFGCTDDVPILLRADIRDQFSRAFDIDLPNEEVGTYARAARRVNDLRRKKTD